MLTMRQALVALTIGLTGCGASNEPTREMAQETDSRPLIEEIVALDAVASGSSLVVRATGVAPVQGYWDGALVPVPDPDPRRLSYAFRAAEPPLPGPVATQRSREVTVGLALTERQLRGVREIRVTAARNSRTLSR